MKKILFAIAALSALSVPAFSQQAFNSLSFGIEAGTTGVGVQLAMPLVTDHIVLVAGFNAPSLNFNTSFDVDMEQVNTSLETVNSNLQAAGLPDRINTRFDDVDLGTSAALNLSTLKAALELYPFKRSSFHITAGVFYGMNDTFISAVATSDKTFWSNYKDIQAEVAAINEKYKDEPGYTPADISSIRASVNGHTYEVKEHDGAGRVDMNLVLPRVRPYATIGFGRSMPKGHFSFQGDLGVFYARPEISSPNEVEFDPSAEDLLKDLPGVSPDRLCFWPMLSLRLIYKIF